MTEQPLDRHDLDSLKEWIGAKFETVEAKLGGMDEAIKVAADEREKKDAELNDVRLRFIARETFETQVGGLQRQLDDLKRSRSIIVGVGLVMVPLSGVVGAAIVKAFG